MSRNDDKGKQTGPVAGGADNTRGENKPSHEGNSGDAKEGKDKFNQGTNANLTTTSRGADSTDKEFRNNQPNASTVTDLESKKNKGDKNK